VFPLKERSPSASSRPRIEDKLGLSEDEGRDDGMYSENVERTLVPNHNFDQVMLKTAFSPSFFNNFYTQNVFI
jgi:hypothetical protein